MKDLHLHCDRGNSSGHSAYGSDRPPLYYGTHLGNDAFLYICNNLYYTCLDMQLPTTIELFVTWCWFLRIIIIPCTCIRGKVIGHVVVVVVVIMSTKIAISRDIGAHKHNESIKFSEKLASVCIKSMDTDWYHKINSAFLLASVATPINSA